MREIKFRVFDKTFNRMRLVGTDTHDSLYCFSNGTVQYYNLQNGEGSGEDGDYILMQYTGLHDKNGKEIYEGDIIKREFEIGRDIIDPVSLGFVDREIEESGYFIGVVCYRPSEGFILNKCKKYDDEGKLQSKRSGVKIHHQYAEVIGNIYEHPHLLEGGDAE
ncbi:YopX family protein [Fictibacillus sp. Mic-4]|uniref:YopX family protein n=1 Tax=Fictibacillus sp. Mic-4 TaxID=3132826 RepID=UPI003CECD507